MVSPLTWRLARACEYARTPVCTCRCRGAWHGTARGAPDTLPAGDPHATPQGRLPLDGETLKSYNGTGGENYSERPTTPTACPTCGQAISLDAGSRERVGSAASDTGG